MTDKKIKLPGILKRFAFYLTLLTAQITIAVHAQQGEAKVIDVLQTTDTIILSGGSVWDFGPKRKLLKGLHDTSSWNQLAKEILLLKNDSDLSYYYLGRASEGLGIVEAAKKSYIMALSARKCDGRIANLCDGFVFPKDIDSRLEHIKTNLEKNTDTLTIASKDLPANTIDVQKSKLPEDKNTTGSFISSAGNRRALVIGNDTYKNVQKLNNAREDAKTIASNLTSFGYSVTLKLDLNEKEMKAALRTFSSQVQGGDEVMFFFAGHGVQLGSSNYLLPVDILGDSEAQVRDEAIQLQRVLDDMSDRKAKFTLAMIDACRDNPFKTSGRAIGGRGLSPTTAATGQMVIFSAGTGQQALDKLSNSDKSKNGLFTRIFSQEMQKPNLSIDRIVKNVRNQVADLAKSVGHEQVPAIYDQVLGDFFFNVSK